MGEESVVVTYETLFEMLRRERSRGELQELDPQFFSHVVSYIEEKKALGEKHEQEDLFGEEARLKTEKQLFNIKKLLRQLYELREKKITEMALNKSRTQSPILDESALLPGEKALYDQLISLFDHSRNELLYSVLNGTKVQETTPLQQTASTEETTIEETPAVDPVEAVEPQHAQDLLTLRFLEDVAEFAGDDMKFYGPFSKGQEGAVPEQLGRILLGKGVAEEISPAQPTA